MTGQLSSPRHIFEFLCKQLGFYTTVVGESCAKFDDFFEN